MNGQKPDRDGLLREMEAYQDTIYMVEVFCSYLKKGTEPSASGGVRCIRGAVRTGT